MIHPFVSALLQEGGEVISVSSAPCRGISTPRWLQPGRGMREGGGSRALLPTLLCLIPLALAEEGEVALRGLFSSPVLCLASEID